MAAEKNLFLYRHTANTDGDRCIIGDLYDEDEFFCFTLEDEIRSSHVKVYGETCIKADRYEVVLTVSNRFKRLMPLLLNVPMFSGIRIHGGNTSKDTLGCVLVAHNTDFKKIWSTAEKSLTKILSGWKAKNPDGKIFINIQNRFLTYSKYNGIDN